MFKTASALMLSATLALAGLSAAPAHANDGEDLARFLFGAAALAIIAKSVNDRADRHSVPQHAPDRVIRGEVLNRGSVVTPHRPQHARSVPAVCQRTIATDNGNRRLYGVPCLRREGVNVARLPQNCLRRVELPRRTVDAFAQQCLRREGVRVVN